MRKVVSILITFIFIFTFAACGAKVDTPYPLESGDGIYTITFVSDTQRYSQDTNGTNQAMIKALVDVKDEYNIEYVIHSGDLVQRPENDNEWQVALESMKQLDGVIPYGVLAGNHDQDVGENRFTAYSKYFGEDFYKDKSYFDASFEDCRAHSQLVTIGGKDFVVVYISDDPSSGCIDFANEIFVKYSDRIGILVTHKYMEPDLSLEEMGEYMLEKIVKPNQNVKMVLCGHESAAGYLETELDDGRTILQIMANYQDANNASMMYLQINENEKTLTGISYSPIKDTYEGYPDQDNDQFRVALPW